MYSPHAEASRQEKVSLRLHLNLKSNMPTDTQGGTASIKHGTAANLSVNSFPMKKENYRQLTQAPKCTAKEHLAS